MSILRVFYVISLTVWGREQFGDEQFGDVSLSVHLATVWGRTVWETVWGRVTFGNSLGTCHFLYALRGNLQKSRNLKQIEVSAFLLFILL